MSFVSHPLAVTVPLCLMQVNALNSILTLSNCWQMKTEKMENIEESYFKTRLFRIADSAWSKKLKKRNKKNSVESRKDVIESSAVQTVVRGLCSSLRWVRKHHLCTGLRTLRVSRNTTSDSMYSPLTFCSLCLCCHLAFEETFVSVSRSAFDNLGIII